MSDPAPDPDPAPPPLETDLTRIAELAQIYQDDFEVLLYQLQLDDDLDDARLDAFVDALAAPVIAAIDCTQCANCCRSLDVYVTPEDAQRLADGTFVPLDSILNSHIEHEQAALVGEWGRLRAKPCAFLQGNLCSVYAQRPETCRIYPAFTPDFRLTLDDTIDGAGVCPIIFNVLRALLRRVNEIYRL